MKNQIKQLEKNVSAYTLKPEAKVFIGFKKKGSWSKYVIRLKNRKPENMSEHIDQLLYGVRS